MSDEKSRRAAPWRAAVYLGGIPLAAFGSKLIALKFAASENALSATAGLSATFAGFIVAILTILGDASALLPGNWRLAATQAEEIEHRSMRLRYTFFCYLSASFLSLYMISISKDVGILRDTLAYVLTTVVIYTFLISTDLPTTLRSIQRDRVEAIIEQRLARERSAIASPPE